MAGQGGGVFVGMYYWKYTMMESVIDGEKEVLPVKEKSYECSINIFLRYQQKCII